MTWGLFYAQHYGGLIGFYCRLKCVIEHRNWVIIEETVRQTTYCLSGKNNNTTDISIDTHHDSLGRHCDYYVVGLVTRMDKISVWDL